MHPRAQRQPTCRRTTRRPVCEMRSARWSTAMLEGAATSTWPCPILASCECWVGGNPRALVFRQPSAEPVACLHGPVCAHVRQCHLYQPASHLTQAAPYSGSQRSHLVHNGGRGHGLAGAGRALDQAQRLLQHALHRLRLHGSSAIDREESAAGEVLGKAAWLLWHARYCHAMAHHSLCAATTHLGEAGSCELTLRYPFPQVEQSTTNRCCWGSLNPGPPASG